MYPAALNLTDLFCWPRGLFTQPFGIARRNTSLLSLSHVIVDWTRVHPLWEGTTTPTALRKSCINFQRYRVDSCIFVSFALRCVTSKAPAEKANSSRHVMLMFFNRSRRHVPECQRAKSFRSFETKSLGSRDRICRTATLI
jgi:hypothetical protein